MLALIDIRTGYNDVFSAGEAVYFETEAELYEKIDFYRKNPRKRMEIAEAGWRKYHALFNERRVAGYVADILFTGCRSLDYPL